LNLRRDLAEETEGRLHRRRSKGERVRAQPGACVPGLDYARMKTQWIELEVDGSAMPSYVAAPDGRPLGAVVVLQEIFGVNAPMQKLTELTAGAGYFAIAPALFHRTDPAFEAEYSGPGFAKGLAAAGAVTFEGAIADIRAACAYVKERLGPDTKIATWGFCFGGSIAMLSATMPEISAAVSFYGGQIVKSAVPSRPSVLSLAAEVVAPIFFAFGGKDEHISPEDHAAIRKALNENGKPYEFRVFPQEDHGFFRQGPDGNPGSAEVWPLVQQFLAAHLA
jgi:carboxymethylenebutenolidase